MDLKKSISVAQDIDRLAVMKELDLLDSERAESFDRLSRLASIVTNSPVSLISLLGFDGQFFKGQIGLKEPYATRRKTPLSHSFCMHVVADNSPLIVEDAREHPVLKDNLAIPDLDVIAYLGIPLTTSEGVGLGSLCVIDNEPRKWTQREIDILTEMASLVMTEIELRHQVKARQKAEKALQEYAESLVLLVDDRTKEIKTLYDQLLKIDLQKSKFISDISHELRTPVTTMTLYLDLLRQANSNNRGKYESALRKENERLVLILNKILDFSDLQRWLIEAGIEPVDLNDLIVEIVKKYEPLAINKGLILSYELGLEKVKIMGDSDQIGEIVSHLLMNAINYTLFGGVHIEMEPDYENKIVQIVVQDSGMGMNETEMAHCFDRFYRGEQVGQFNNIPGAGLGLAKVKDIVTFYQGWVDVKSEVDKGSVFSVFLPII